MALVTTRGMGMPTLPVRLQWRGVEVSEEFQAYAARVALGEELAPYRGAVLARPCSDFQWSSFQEQQQEPTEPLAASPVVARSLKQAAWLFGIAGGMLAALGLCSGAFSAQPSEGYSAVDSATVALKPVAPIVSDITAAGPAQGSASLHDDASDWVASDTPPPVASAHARRPAPSSVRRTVPRAVAAVTTAQPPAAPATKAEGLGHTASELARPAAASPVAPTSAAPVARGAAPVPSEGFRTAALGDGVASGASGFESTGASTLFSDQPPF